MDAIGVPEMSMDGTPGASDMVNSQENKYPRIWDRGGERKIIGEK